MPLFLVGWRLLQVAPGRFIRVKHHLYADTAASLGGLSTGLQWALNPREEVAFPGLLLGPIRALAQWCHSDSDGPGSIGSRSYSTASTDNAVDNGHAPGAPIESNSLGGGTKVNENANSATVERRDSDSRPAIQRGGAQERQQWGRKGIPVDALTSAAHANVNPSKHMRPSAPVKTSGARTWKQVGKLMGGASRGKGPVSARARPQDYTLQQLWAHLRDGHSEQARQELHEWLACANGVSIKAFNYLLKACATGEQVELGFHVYASMQESGVPPDAKSIGWILRMLVRAGQVDQALSWLPSARACLPSMENCETGALLPSAYFLNVLLEECITRKDWTAAGQCADELGHLGMDAKTFCLLLQIAGMEQRPAAVALTWAGLQAAGVVPTLEQRMTHIQALARCDLVDQAARELRVLGKIIADGGAGDGSGLSRTQDGAGTATGADGGADLGGGEEGSTSTGASQQRGLWWTAPPPRSTDKSALAMLRVSYNVVIAAAARAKDVDQAQALFAEMRRADLQPDRFTYNALLRATTAAGEVVDTLRVYRSMQAGGTIPDEYTVHALLTNLVGAGLLDEAAQLLEDADTKGAEKFGRSYNGLLAACAKQGESQRAVRVFGEMKEKGVAADECTYLALFQAFIRITPLASASTAEEWEAERDAVGAVLMVEEDMRNSGVKHTAATQAALIAALGPNSLDLLQSRVARAKRGHTRGEAPLNAAFFAMTIGVCNRVSTALSLLDDMDALGVAPNASVFAAALNCCAHERDVATGLRLADRMLREGIPADTVTVNTMIKLCCYGLQYHAALPLLFRMEAAGLATDTFSYNPLLRSCLGARDLTTLEVLLERMKRRGLAPDGDTCLAAVRAYLQQDRPDEAAEALDALTARMFGHGGSILEDQRSAEQKTRSSVGRNSSARGDGDEVALRSLLVGGWAWGRQQEAGQQRCLHGDSRSDAEEEATRGAAGETEEWEFVGDRGAPEAKVEDAETAALLREAALFPGPEARAKFLARMVGVSGGGFEGSAPQWEERAVQQREVDWNSWAHRLRRQYDERRASRRRRTGNEETALS